MIGNDRMKKLEKNSELRRDLLICGHIDTVAMRKKLCFDATYWK